MALRKTHMQASPEAARAAAARLAALAQEAHEQVCEETANGGEPAYPVWIDDVRTVIAYIDQTTKRGSKDA